MGLSYISADENDFSLGIDARSAENQIAPGFVKDLLNADIVEKRPRTRPGYQGYAGNVPVRVTSLEYEDASNQICFTLDSASVLADVDVDLSGLSSTPIVVYGRSSSIASGGPFTTAGDTVRYYSGFTVQSRKTFIATASAPPFETLSIAQGEHGIATTNMFATVVESTSTINKSYSLALPHEISLDEATADMTVSYQNSTGTDRDVFVYYRDQTPVTGDTYVATLAHTGTGSESFTITAGTHALSNFNIIAQVQQDTGADRVFVKPDSLTIASNGNVTVVLNSPSATTYYAILEAAPVANQATGNVGGSTTGTVTLTGLTSPWVFYGIYLEVTPGGDKEVVYPDSIDYDDGTATATLTFTNGSTSARNFIVYYDYGVIRSNQLCVTDTSVTVDATDTRPQLTIWGLDHTEIYGTTPTDRAGWVTHVDSYRSAGEQRLLSGLGGNLFSAQTYSEAGTNYDYALLYPSLQARTSTAKVLAPLFWDTGETPARTRGYVTGTTAATNWVTVTAVEYDTGNGWTKYTLSVPGKAILDSAGSPTALSSVISVTSGLEDWLTVQGMSYARHEGTFKIRQILDGTNEIDIWVENEFNSADYDDSGVTGLSGVFTDQFTWLTTAPFLPGDTLSSAALGDTIVSTVLSSSSTTTVADGIVDMLSIAGGILTTGTRTSNVISARSSQPAATASVTNAVRGDMLSYSSPDESWDGRLLRVLYINPDTDRSVTITESLGTATVTMGSGDTSFLAEGRSVILQNAGVFTGTVAVVDVLSPTTWTFTTEETGTGIAGTLLGKTLQIDENLEWQDTTDDSVALQTERRWIPVEAPDDSYNLTPSTNVRYFDSNAYGNQPFLRSTIVQNNTYLTNGDDEVYKYDGVNNYRAGLFSWQPGLFVTQDTAATAKIVADNPTSTPTVFANGIFTVPLGEEQKFPVGSRVRHSYTGGSDDYSVVQIYDDTTNGFVKIQRTKTSTLGAAPSLTKLSTRRYYFRLNAVDANDNIVASAVTGYQDHVVEIAADAAINLKLVGMPSWDVYDYDRLEVEIYGTKLNTAAPFYRETTLQLDFDNTQGYINYTDAFADNDLIELDVVNTALKGTELGTAWQEPLRASYVTSIGNSLILANLKDYPQLDIQMVASAAVTNTTYAGKIWTFRRDNTDTGTTTDMISRVRFEFINGTTNNAGSFSIGTNQFSFTATSLPGTVAAGDWIYLSYNTVGTSSRELTYSGWWQIATVVSTTVTVNLVGAAAAGSYPDKYTVATDPTDVPVLLGTDGNLGQVNGDSFDLFDTMRRMSMALNASMRMVDTTLTGMTTFTPWLVSRGGNDVGKAGRLIVRQPRADDTTASLLLPSSFSGGGQSFQVFVNDVRRVSSSSVSTTTRLYPSRLLVSYENYSEIFDNPTAILDTDSDSAIDVNSADGQEITGVLPFFGEAAFTAAQQTAVLVVFKTNSIYLVDINQKRLGNQAVQRIETEGLGCTAPYSIAVTKNGICFANESGIYCLRRNQAIQYIGRYMERNWTERVDQDQLAICQGHHYGVGRSYKLSVPLSGDDAASEVYVYNHTGEDEGRLGAWSRYDNHPATGWANLASDAFFSSTQGRVMSLRRTGSETDFRDDSSPITFQLDTRALDFGNGGIRKVVDSAVVNYRTQAPSTSAEFLYSLDLAREYSETTSITLINPQPTSGIDDEVGADILPIRHNTDRRRGVYFQARISCSTLDEPIEVAGISFKVGGLTDKGIKQAAQSR